MAVPPTGVGTAADLGSVGALAEGAGLLPGSLDWDGCAAGTPVATGAGADFGAGKTLSAGGGAGAAAGVETTTSRDGAAADVTA